MGMNGQRHAPAVLCHRERNLGTRWRGDWVDLRTGLETRGRKNPLPLPGIEPLSTSL
jgi:hypothetical protein